MQSKQQCSLEILWSFSFEVEFNSCWPEGDNPEVHKEQYIPREHNRQCYVVFFIFAKCYGLYACDLGRMQQLNKKVCAPCISSLLAYLLLGLHARSYAK